MAPHQTHQPEGLAAGAAGAAVRCLLGHPAADDGGQLLGAGHHLAPSAASSSAPNGSPQVMRDEDLHAALLRQLGFSLAVLAGRDPAGHRAGPVDAGRGLEVVGRAGARGAVAADPLERGGHDLADLRPRRHRAARARRCKRLGSTTATPATRATPG